MRIYQPDGQPPAGFEASPATLEDAYLLLMQDVAQSGQSAQPEPYEQRRQEPEVVAAGGAA